VAGNFRHQNGLSFALHTAMKNDMNGAMTRTTLTIAAVVFLWITNWKLSESRFRVLP
jgi:hypothetical protein